MFITQIRKNRLEDKDFLNLQTLRAQPYLINLPTLFFIKPREGFDGVVMVGYGAGLTA